MKSFPHFDQFSASYQPAVSKQVCEGDGRFSHPRKYLCGMLFRPEGPEFFLVFAGAWVLVGW